MIHTENNLTNKAFKISRKLIMNRIFKKDKV